MCVVVLQPSTAFYSLPQHELTLPPLLPFSPNKLTRRFDVRLVPESTRKAVSLREIKAGHIGALTVTQGIVTRISDVRPMLTVATYVP